MREGEIEAEGKRTKAEHQHVTSETLSTHEKSQVMPRSDQNNNRSARTWIVSPTHKLPPSWPFSQKYAVRLCSCQSWLFAALAAFVFLHNSLFLPDHKPKHQLTLSVYQQSFDELGSLLGEFVTADLKNESYCETFPPQKKKGGVWIYVINIYWLVCNFIIKQIETSWIQWLRWTSLSSLVAFFFCGLSPATYVSNTNVGGEEKVFNSRLLVQSQDIKDRSVVSSEKASQKWKKSNKATSIRIKPFPPHLNPHLLNLNQGTNTLKRVYVFPILSEVLIVSRLEMQPSHVWTAYEPNDNSWL